jgi:stage II sporulation protein D
MQYGHAYSGGIGLLTDISVKDKPATIKVLIAKDKKSVLLEAKGGYGVYNPSSQLQLATGAASKRDFVFYRPEGMVWGDQFSDISSIRIVPLDAQSSILVDGIEYRGCVELHAQKGGLSIINEVDIERYLKSTLTFSFAEEMDSEVLEAVAIAARTHAYYLMTRGPDTVWHIDATDAGYEGNALTLQNLNVHQAIQNTRNMIMTFDGAPFPAAWTRDSAGRTADFARVFRKKVKAPHAVATPIAAKERAKHMWFFEISKKELARKLATQLSPTGGLQKITDIGLFQDKDSKKVYALRIKNGESTRNIDFFTLQKALGSTSLKSNDFILELKGDKIYFTGYGEGHGVGMCLLSASYYADKGEKSHEILSHFFPNTQLEHRFDHMSN